MLVDRLRGVAALSKPRRHGVYAERRGVDVIELGPVKRTGDAGVGHGTHGVSGGDRPVAGVLVVVDEDADSLFLPPLACSAAGHSPLDLARERQCRAADFLEAALRAYAHVHVDATRTRCLREADQSLLLEHLANAARDCANLVEGDGWRRIEVDAQLVGAVEVPTTDRPRVPVDHAEVDPPGEVRGVRHHELARRASAGELDRRRRQPIRRAVRHALLEEEVAGDAVDPTFQCRWALAQMANDRLGAFEVVVDEVELGDADLWEEELRRIRDADLATCRLDGDRLGLRAHAGARFDASVSIPLRECRTMHVDDRPVLVAPDSFKGTLRAPTVAAAVARGLEHAGLRADRCPVADGGEGTMEVLLERLGGEIVEAAASDPLGRQISASFALLGGGATALVEVAAATGLHLVASDERDAEAASSAGTGELIAAAIAAGAAHVLVAAGGSASTDGGVGAIEAVAAAGGLRGTRLSVLCDVRTPFEQAASVFGPQKGADEAAVERLERRLEALGMPRGVPMSGAAGALAGGLWAKFGAALVAGAPFVLHALDFNVRMLASAAVIVGEGRLDATSLEGKIAAEIATRARQHGVPAHGIVGSCALERFDARILDLQVILEATDEAGLERAGFELAAAIAPRSLPSRL